MIPQRTVRAIFTAYGSIFSTSCLLYNYSINSYHCFVILVLRSRSSGKCIAWWQFVEISDGFDLNFDFFIWILLFSDMISLFLQIWYLFFCSINSSFRKNLFLVVFLAFDTLVLDLILNILDNIYECASILIGWLSWAFFTLNRMYNFHLIRLKLSNMEKGFIIFFLCHTAF